MNNKELVFSVTKKDLEIDWFSGTGAGGQHRNKCKNSCRIRHKDSGVIVTAQDQRSQKENLKNAFIRLSKHPRFKIWLNSKIYENDKNHIDIEKRIDNMMKDENLKIEYLGGGENE